MESFSAIIDGVWDSGAAFAADIGVLPVTGRAWRTRDWIPPEYWCRVVARARARGVEISFALLARLAARRLAHREALADSNQPPAAASAASEAEAFG